MKQCYRNITTDINQPLLGKRNLFRNKVFLLTYIIVISPHDNSIVKQHPIVSTDVNLIHRNNHTVTTVCIPSFNTQMLDINNNNKNKKISSSASS